MKILLLEDNAIDTDLIRRSLPVELPACEIHAVTSLASARQALNQAGPFDIALLDVKIPDGNGLEILTEIRGSGVDMVVILLTGTGDEDLAVAALKAGADDYLVKQADYAARLPVVLRLACERRQQSAHLTAQNICLLYVEHNAVDLDLTQRHFARYAPHFQCDCVPHAEAALERLRAEQEQAAGQSFDAILVDYRLPGMNALDFIKAVRQECKLDVPLIVITGQGTEEIAVQSLKLGANDYLVKREGYLFRAPAAIINAIQLRTLLGQQLALAESEARYRLLAENSSDVIFTVGIDLTLGYISPAIFKMTGHLPQEFIGQPLACLLSAPQAEAAQGLLQELGITEPDGEAVRKSPQLSWEHNIRAKDGSSIPVETILTLLSDEAGLVTGLLGTARNISKRKRFEEESRKLTQAVIQSPVSISITDKNGRIEYVNPQFTCISGYTLKEIQGRNPRFLKSGRHSDAFYRNLWETIVSGRNWTGELENKKKNGEHYWVSASISPLLDETGAITHFIAVKEDITARKKLMEELTQAKERAEAADRLKTAFLNNISHEVRTPLNGILGFAEILLEPDLTEAEKQAHLEILNESTERLVHTMTAYMDGSLLLSGNMQPQLEMVSINKLMRNVTEPYLQRCRKKALRLVLDVPAGDLEIRTDGELLSKAFKHLLDNAVKFTASGSICFGYAASGGELQFFIHDTGIGIAPEQQESIFDYFQQEDTRTSRGYEGSGLGLYIVKGICKLLGGSIQLESEKGGGTRIHLTLPTRIRPEAARADRHKSPPSEAPVLVLVVEDDACNRLYLEKLLAGAGYQYLSAENGLEAVEACRQNPAITLVLMDLKLPVICGFDATRIIKREHSGLPVIALSAYAMADDVNKAREAGCDDYLTKPFSRHQLLETIERILASPSA